MSPLNSSTSSSEPAGRRRWFDALATLGWTIAALACIDVAAGVAFRPSSNPRVPPSSFQAYFEYGRSLEGKLDLMLGRTDDRTSPICFAGWLKPLPGDDQPKAPGPGADRMVALYGMSFTNHVGAALAKLDPRFTVRLIAGPGAPPNFAYAAFEGDRGRQDADTVVLGVLDSSVVGLLSDNGLCRNFQAPQPFFYPTYQATDDGLTRHDPPIQSLADLRAIWFDPARRGVMADDLEAWDAFYSPLFFNKNVLDASSIGRLIRRSLFRSHYDRVTAGYFSNGRFVENSPMIRTLRLIVKRFAADARADGKLPVVLMIQDGQSGDRLQSALQPTLDEAAILSLNTNTICPTSDRLYFLPDTHFTHEGDRMIAEALAKLLRAHPPSTAADSAR